MTADKPINCVQLDQEAAALTDSTHVGHGLNYDDDTKVLWCVGMDDACASVKTAYETHVAEPVTPPDPLKPYREALATAAADDSSLSEATKTALTNLLAAMAPQAA